MLTSWHGMTFCISGPCITNVFATRRKNFSQWHRSFQRKLLSHWLKFLRHVAITLVIQGPGPLWGESIGYQWIPLTKDQWCGALVCSVLLQAIKQTVECRWFEMLMGSNCNVGDENIVEHLQYIPIPYAWFGLFMFCCGIVSHMLTDKRQGYLTGIAGQSSRASEVTLMNMVK